MIKESIFFVASTGLLIYLVSPEQEPPKTEVAADVAEKPDVVISPAPDDGWGYDDSSAEDTGFVFGEPLTLTGEGYGDSEATGEDEDGNDRTAAAFDVRGRTGSATSADRQLSANSPGPDERGGMNNPIVLNSESTGNPVDR